LFVIERHQAGVALQRSVSSDDPPSSGHEQWQRNVNFSGETEALFSARFGGLVLDVVQRLDSFGLTDENLGRMLGWGSMALRISSYDIGGLAGVISALCQQIPYD
jgi:hypothetical protein